MPKVKVVYTKYSKSMGMKAAREMAKNAKRNLPKAGYVVTVVK